MSISILLLPHIQPSSLPNKPDIILLKKKGSISAVWFFVVFFNTSEHKMGHGGKIISKSGSIYVILKVNTCNSFIFSFPVSAVTIMYIHPVLNLQSQTKNGIKHSVLMI